MYLSEGSFIREINLSLLNLNKLLITCDKEIYKLRKYPTILLHTQVKEYWLAILNNLIKLPLDINFDNTYCPLCGYKLTRVDKDFIIDNNLNVPKKVLYRNDVFFICFNCGKIYWKGEHYSTLKNKLIKLNILND